MRDIAEWSERARAEVQSWEASEDIDTSNAVALKELVEEMLEGVNTGEVLSRKDVEDMLSKTEAEYKHHNR